MSKNIDILIQDLGEAIFKRTKRLSGHIHVYFNGVRDHIILFYTEGVLSKIAAKSPECEKGVNKTWEMSEFSNYQRENVLRKFYSQIEQIEIDAGNPKTWSSYEELLEWLKSCE